jgi:hypothetical protein
MTASKLAKGQTRPAGYPLRGELVQLITDRVAEEPEITLIWAGRSAYIEEGNEVAIILSSEGPVTFDLRRDLRQMILKAFDGDVKVMVHVLQRSPIDQEEDK